MRGRLNPSGNGGIDNDESCVGKTGGLSCRSVAVELQAASSAGIDPVSDTDSVSDSEGVAGLVIT
jgi:hypothetical protein